MAIHGTLRFGGLVALGDEIIVHLLLFCDGELVVSTTQPTRKPVRVAGSVLFAKHILIARAHPVPLCLGLEPGHLCLCRCHRATGPRSRARSHKPLNDFVRGLHVLRIDASGKDIVKSDRVQPGASADVKFTLTEAGQYSIYCNITGHVDKGQTGTLTVVRN